MLPVRSGVHVWLATGRTDMRKGFPGLSLLRSGIDAKFMVSACAAHMQLKMDPEGGMGAEPGSQTTIGITYRGQVAALCPLADCRLRFRASIARVRLWNEES